MTGNTLCIHAHIHNTIKCIIIKTCNLCIINVISHIIVKIDAEKKIKSLYTGQVNF